MHQTFYVEIDEEISLVVEKLRKSLSPDNYFVLPGRSLVAQSAVNLKLLKREAEKLQKNIIIVTQDEQVARMAQKNGIETRSSTEGSEIAEFAENKQEEKTEMAINGSEKKDRLISVGSEDFYGSKKINQKEAAYHGNINLESVSGGYDLNEAKGERMEIRREDAIDKIRPNINASKNLSDLRVSPRKSNSMKPSDSLVGKNKFADRVGAGYDLKKSFEDFLDPEKEKKLEKILSHKPVPSEKAKAVEVSSGDFRDKSPKGRFLFAFSLIMVVLVAGVAGYFYIPSAEVKVYLERQDGEVSFDVKGDTQIKDFNIQDMAVPVRIIEKEDSVVSTYDSTGISESSGQKAKGTVIIYNEFDSSPQQLVATTRFETEDGKVFRLVKGVSVPGKTSVGGESKPGVIEVEVVADSAGSSYNIEPASFRIPGFKGGEKYDKIYAKSSKKMIGGGLSGDAIKNVSQADIDQAKVKTEGLLREKVENYIKGELSEGEILLPESVKLEIRESTAIATVGDVKEKFDYKASGKARFMVFSENEIRAIAEEIFLKQKENGFPIRTESADLKYDKMQTDFEEGKMNFKVFAKIKAMPVFEGDVFKKNLVAKDEDGVRKLISEYPYIRNLEVFASPDFMMSKLPRLKNRIILEEKEYVSP